MAHPARFERAASAFGGQRSIQLSYGCKKPLPARGSVILPRSDRALVADAFARGNGICGLCRLAAQLALSSGLQLVFAHRRTNSSWTGGVHPGNSPWTSPKIFAVRSKIAAASVERPRMSDLHPLLNHTEDDDCVVCRAADVAEFIAASAYGCYALDETLPQGAIEMAVLVHMAGRLYMQGIDEKVLRTAIGEGIAMAKETQASARPH